MRCFEHIAKLIRAKRVDHPKGYSQSDLSHLLGYKNGQFISNVERALCNVPLKMLSKIIQELDISSDELKDAILKDHAKTLDNYLFGKESSNVSLINRSNEQGPEKAFDEQTSYLKRDVAKY